MKSKQVGGGTGERRGGIICHRCGKPGHIAPKCTETIAQTQAQQNNSPNTNSRARSFVANAQDGFDAFKSQLSNLSKKQQMELSLMLSASAEE